MNNDHARENSLSLFSSDHAGNKSGAMLQPSAVPVRLQAGLSVPGVYRRTMFFSDVPDVNRRFMLFFGRSRGIDQLQRRRDVLSDFLTGSDRSGDPGTITGHFVRLFRQSVSTPTRVHEKLSQITGRLFLVSTLMRVRSR